MKLWEAVSAFRDFKSVVKEVFSSERWHSTYGQKLSQYDEFVRARDRSMLDSYLPVELTREIAARCMRLRFCLSQDGWLRRAAADLTAQPGTTTLSALDVHERFGGSIIEEVLEYGSARVTNHPA